MVREAPVTAASKQGCVCMLLPIFREPPTATRVCKDPDSSLIDVFFPLELP